MEKKKSKNFVLIISIFALIAVGLRLLLGFVVNSLIAQNEDNALTTLKLIATSLDNYSKNHRGIFPENLKQLLDSQPPYLDRNYWDLPSFQGYVFDCPKLLPVEYMCVAKPVICNITGKKIFMVATGGVISSENCIKK